MQKQTNVIEEEKEMDGEQDIFQSEGRVEVI